MNRRLGVDGTEYNPPHQLSYPRPLFSSSSAGGGILDNNTDEPDN